MFSHRFYDCIVQVADRTRDLLGTSYVAAIRKLVTAMYGDLLNGATLVPLRPYNESGFQAIAHASLREWLCTRSDVDCVVYPRDLLDALGSSVWLEPALRRDNARSVAHIVQQEIVSRLVDPLARRADTARHSGRLARAQVWFTNNVAKLRQRNPVLVVFMRGRGHPWNATATCDEDVCVAVLDDLDSNGHEL